LYSLLKPLWDTQVCIILRLAKKLAEFQILAKPVLQVLAKP
jgi:hypothetical protein